MSYNYNQAGKSLNLLIRSGMHSNANRRTLGFVLLIGFGVVCALVALMFHFIKAEDRESLLWFYLGMYSWIGFMFLSLFCKIVTGDDLPYAIMQKWRQWVSWRWREKGFTLWHMEDKDFIVATNQKVTYHLIPIWFPDGTESSCRVWTVETRTLGRHMVRDGQRMSSLNFLLTTGLTWERERRKIAQGLVDVRDPDLKDIAKEFYKRTFK